MRIRDLALAAVLAGALISPALADDLMANTYANTVTTVNKANGAAGKLLFNADGTYTGSGAGPDGKSVAISGTWTASGGNICLSPAGGKTSCSPLAMHAVGDSWTVTNDAGETYDVSLTAGR